MPAVSEAQHKLMEAAAHTKGGYGGVPQAVGKEFVGKDKDCEAEDDEEEAEGEDCLEPNSAIPIANRAHDAAIAFDRASVRSYDVDGRLHVVLTPISRACISPYLGNEIPDYQKFGLDPNRTYQLFRDPNELAKAVASFNNIPLLSTHRPVSAEDHQPKIIIGSTGTDSSFDGEYLKNSLVVWAKDAINDIESGKKVELSAGYRYTYDPTPGVYKGEKFDGVMRNIVANHLATVSNGRVPGAIVADSSEFYLWGLIEKALLGL